MFVGMTSVMTRSRRGQATMCLGGKGCGEEIKGGGCRAYIEFMYMSPYPHP